MIAAMKKEAALLAEIRGSDPGDGFVLWWLGQSGFLVKARCGFLLFDPYLSDSLTKKYAATDKPHVRMTELAIDPARLDFVDVVTSSHNHTDHLDGDTLGPILASGPKTKVVIPEANREFVAARLSCDAAFPIGLNDRQSIEAGGFQIHGIAAAHNNVDRDSEGHCRYLGYVATFGGFAIYHSGDTLWHEHLVDQLRPFDIDIALLPINGKLPGRRVAGNLWGQEAAALAHDANARLLIPCHYEMFTFNTETPEAMSLKCRELGQPFRIMKCGQRLCYPGDLR